MVRLFDYSKETYKDPRYALVIDFTDRFIREGYVIEERVINRKKVRFFVKRKEGKIVEEIPLIEREFDLYITGIYSIREKKHRGEKVEMKIRIPCIVVYGAKEEWLDDFSDEIEEKALEIFQLWLDYNIASGLIDEAMFDEIEISPRPKEELE